MGTVACVMRLSNPEHLIVKFRHHRNLWKPCLMGPTKICTNCYKWHTQMTTWVVFFQTYLLACWYRWQVTRLIRLCGRLGFLFFSFPLNCHQLDLMIYWQPNCWAVLFSVISGLVTAARKSDFVLFLEADSRLVWCTPQPGMANSEDMLLCDHQHL